ncbi:MAG: ACT domain-containing protein [bacterium]|nr:ACT domain-containing protein [bacterium]
MTINQISVFLENKVGQLAQVCKVLADNGVSLVTLSLAETQDFGIARLIVDNHEKAETVLRTNKYLVKTTPVVAVTVPDRPGGMAQVVSTLSEKGCDIEYSYAFASTSSEKAVLVFRFKNETQAEAVLADAGFTTIAENQLQEAAK